jgi:hypothetical protein
MSKFISHLKTVLPRNFADRTWTPMIDGQRTKVPAHWEYLVSVEDAFVKSDVQMQSEAFRPPTPADNPLWICIKSQCEEGGLMEFEDFWNPPQPPDDGGDNGSDNSNNVATLTADFSNLLSSGTGGTGWDKNTSIAETTQNQGGQGGTGGQGIGLAIEKKVISFSEEAFLEKSSTVALTGVLEGGQCECRVDSCDLTQDRVNQAEYRDPPVDLKQGNLPFYQRADGQIEIDKSAIIDSTPINAIAPEDDLSGWLAPGELEGMARDLAECDDIDMLAGLRQCWHPEAMNAACKLLSPEKHSQIKEWEIQLNTFVPTES